MNIQLANMDHLEEVMELLSAVVKDMNKCGLHQWGEDYPSREMFVNHINDQVLRIVLDGKKIIAFFVVTEQQDKEYTDIDWEDKSGRAMVIHRLAVHPDRQREGIGSKMMDFAENYARDKGFTSIRLDTYSDNPRTPKLYKKRGYKYRGITHFPQRELDYYCFEKIL